MVFEPDGSGVKLAVRTPSRIPAKPAVSAHSTKLRISQGAQEQLGLWPHYEVIRHLMGSIAVAVQKGNALMVLQAYSTALAKAAAEGDDASAVAAEK